MLSDEASAHEVHGKAGEDDDAADRDDYDVVGERTDASQGEPLAPVVDHDCRHVETHVALVVVLESLEARVQGRVLALTGVARVVRMQSHAGLEGVRVTEEGLHVSTQLLRGFEEAV